MNVIFLSNVAVKINEMKQFASMFFGEDWEETIQGGNMVHTGTRETTDYLGNQKTSRSSPAFCVSL